MTKSGGDGVEPFNTLPCVRRLVVAWFGIGAGNLRHALRECVSRCGVMPPWRFLRRAVVIVSARQRKWVGVPFGVPSGSGIPADLSIRSTARERSFFRPPFKGEYFRDGFFALGGLPCPALPAYFVFVLLLFHLSPARPLSAKGLTQGGCVLNRSTVMACSTSGEASELQRKPGQAGFQFVPGVERFNTPKRENTAAAHCGRRTFLRTQ